MKTVLLLCMMLFTSAGFGCASTSDASSDATGAKAAQCCGDDKCCDKCPACCKDCCPEGCCDDGKCCPKCPSCCS